MEEALAVEVLPGAGEEAVVTKSAAGNDGDCWEVGRAAGLVVDAGWAVEGWREPAEVERVEEIEEEIKEEEGDGYKEEVMEKEEVEVKEEVLEEGTVEEEEKEVEEGGKSLD